MEGLVALAVLIERIVETFVAPFFEKYKWDALYLRAVAIGIGTLITVAGNLNALALAPGLSTIHPLLGSVLTGILIGGGASLLHEFLPKKKE